jgi:ARG and Rhodanese-Phosphatase-superfamily-associated Protein domain
VVAPDQKPVPLDVFCVEHGRWGGRAAETYAGILPTAGEGEPIAGFAANLSLDVAQTAEVANAGKFVGSIGNLNAHGRVAVLKDKNQSKVWDEVAKQNTKNTVESTTGTFTSNYSNVESADRLVPFIEQLLKPIDETKNIVGVIVAVNGEVKSMDVFEATPLFRKLWPKLLKSYALDAASEQNGKETAKTATRIEALSFLRETAKVNRSNVETKGDLAVSHSESDRVLLFSAHQRRQPDIGDPSGSGVVETKAMIGGLGGAIHSAGFAK